MDRTLIAALLFCALHVAGCSTPECPPNYVKHGKTCSHCPEGSEVKGNKCVSLDGGVEVEPVTADEDADVEEGDDASADVSTEPNPGADASVSATNDAGRMDASVDASVALAPRDFALGTAGAPCASELEQSLACEGHASRKILKCQAGSWQVLQTCAPNERCDSRLGTEQGTCATVPAACVGKSAGEICDGLVRLECGIDLVSVTTKACSEHAHCDAASGVRCACDTGYQDDGMGGCRNPDDCPAGACSGGKCVDGLGDYSCDCNSGFAGTGTKKCTAVLYCPKDACTPGGTCNDTMNWSCACNTGYTGTGTQACANQNDCPSNRCLAPNGTCQDQVGTYKCTCNAGFSGTDCVNDICSPNPCKNGGTCSRTGTLCTCPAGYSGTNCQADVCNPNPCLNGGTCSRTGNRCACPPGFSGTNCEVDACSPNPCVNGGTCSRTTQGASCTCPVGLGGLTCANEIMSCASNNLCTLPDYPCAQTMPTGYTCLGRFADWRMPSNSGTPNSYSYVASADVVTDNVTGLVWQRYVPAIYPGCTGTTTTRGDSCSWAEAKAYCENLSLGGSSDWRIPSRIELQSLIDESKTAAPTIDQAAFPSTPATGFWTSASFTDFSGVGYFVDLSNGATRGVLGNGLPFPVRCVRGIPQGDSTPAHRYVVDAASNTVRDVHTTLTWHRNLPSAYPTCSGRSSASAPIGTSCTWAEAKAYCASLGQGYRLPSMKELLTIVDPSRSIPAIDASLFPSTQAVGFWSSTPVLGSGTSAFYVSFENGTASSFPIDMPYPLVRCVR